MIQVMILKKSLKKVEPEFTTICNYLNSLEGVIFTRLTGSGSCIFSVFENKEKAEWLKKIYKKF